MVAQGQKDGKTEVAPFLRTEFGGFLSEPSAVTPFDGATATFALNPAVWFLLGLLIAAPFSGDCVAHQSRVFTYPPAPNSGAISMLIEPLILSKCVAPENYFRLRMI